MEVSRSQALISLLWAQPWVEAAFSYAHDFNSLIAIWSITSVDRRRKNKMEIGKEKTMQGTTLEQYLECCQRWCKGIIDFQGLRQSPRKKNEDSLLCKSAQQSMTKCPVGQCGGESAEQRRPVLLPLISKIYINQENVFISRWILKVMILCRLLISSFLFYVTLSNIKHFIRCCKD